MKCSCGCENFAEIGYTNPVIGDFCEPEKDYLDNEKSYTLQACVNCGRVYVTERSLERIQHHYEYVKEFRKCSKEFCKCFKKE